MTSGRKSKPPTHQVARNPPPFRPLLLFHLLLDSQLTHCGAAASLRPASTSPRPPLHPASRSSPPRLALISTPPRAHLDLASIPAPTHPDPAPTSPPPPAHSISISPRPNFHLASLQPQPPRETIPGPSERIIDSRLIGTAWTRSTNRNCVWISS